MSATAEPLDGGTFPPPTLEAWRELALAKLPAGTALEHTLDDGVTIPWLFTAADALAPDPGGVPARAPFTRGVRTGRAWEIRQEHAHPERATAAAQVLEDLVGGATAVTLRLDRAAREGIAPGAAAFPQEGQEVPGTDGPFAGRKVPGTDGPFAGARGVDGIALSTLDDLDEVLAEVLLDLAPVALDAGAQALPAAALLVALWERRELDRAGVRGALRCDPLGALAAEGLSAGSPAEALAAAGALAAEADALLPAATSLAVDTRAHVAAGATAAQELAIAVATGAAYLRACEAAGLAPARAAARIEFTLQVGADQFVEIAKLRAARRLWARVLEVAGVPAERRWSPLHARTSARTLSAVDPWVNVLRGTTGAFAAATGGADGLSVTSFDVRRGLPGRLGRRVARNTQHVLHDAPGLGRVADPAGGSWYVESLTDQLARRAWELVQELERDGGMLAALRSGRLAELLAASAGRQDEEVARRVRRLTGVNTFPLLGDDGLRPEAGPDLGALARLDAARLAGPGTDVAALRAAPPGGRLAAAAALAREGARLDELAAAGPALVRAAPLRPVLAAHAFEALRAAAAAHEARTGDAPRLLLACVGPLARSGPAALWARAFFAAGGLRGVDSGPRPDAAALGAALREDGARLAVLCAHRDEDDDVLAAAASALHDAGAELVLLAQAGDERARAVGADRGARDGQDAVALLHALHDRLGVAPEEPR